MIAPELARLVFKITTAAAWAEACVAGSFAGSADDVRDGFIHLSDAAQLTDTANKYFSRRPDLVLVAFRASDLSRKLVWEPSRGGALFPHYYGALPVAAACWSAPLPLDMNGRPCVDETLKGPSRRPRDLKAQG